MANRTNWAADVGWTTVTFTASDFNSQPSGGGGLSSAITLTNQDQYMDVSFVVTVGGTTIPGGFMSIFVLPLNQDGTTWGDGYASSTTTQPAGQYGQGSVQPKIGVTSGNTIVGQFQFIPVPSDGAFKLALGDNLSIALGTTAALTCKYRTYNVNLNF